MTARRHPRSAVHDVLHCAVYVNFGTAMPGRSRSCARGVPLARDYARVPGRGARRGDGCLAGADRRGRRAPVQAPGTRTRVPGRALLHRRGLRRVPGRSGQSFPEPSRKSCTTKRTPDHRLTEELRSDVVGEPGFRRVSLWAGTSCRFGGVGAEVTPTPEDRSRRRDRLPRASAEVRRGPRLSRCRGAR